MAGRLGVENYSHVQNQEDSKEEEVFPRGADVSHQVDLVVKHKQIVSLCLKLLLQLKRRLHYRFEQFLQVSIDWKSAV